MDKLILNIDEFGLQESKAKDIKKLYLPMLEALESIESEFNGLVIKEINTELIASAKELRLRIVKIRTSADKIRKNAKAEYIRANNAIQAAYNTLEFAVKSKEDKLMDIEKHYENIEKERINALQVERAAELVKYEADNIPDFLGAMDTDIWNNYFNGVKLGYEQKKAAEKEREKAAKAAEDDRKRVFAENIKLKAAKEKADKIAKDQKAKADKAAKELKEKEDAIAADKAAKEKERLDKIEADAAKDDGTKMTDLIADLTALKSKYIFKSNQNIKLYNSVGLLLDKIINYIKEKNGNNR